MPVRSLTSPILTWPDGAAVDRAVRGWVEQVVARQPQVLRVAYFGSYARGDWGVGSDLDLLVVVDRSDAPFERRAAQWDATELPVPAELLVYTRDEWEAMARRRGRFYQTVMRDAVWVYGGEALGRPQGRRSAGGR